MNNSTNWVSHTPDKNQAQDPYQPPSPPSAFEKFFLPLGNKQESFGQAANHLALSKSFRSEASSINTQDFATAAEELSQATDADLDDISIERNFYQDDILGISHSNPEETSNPMARRKKKTKIVTMSTDPAETIQPNEVGQTETCTTDDSPHFDVVEHVYEGVKSAWAFGKGVVVFKPLMGIAENVAVKVLSAATGVNSLDDVDKNVKPHLKGIDKEFIDPAILKIWSLIEPIVGKSEDVARSMIALVHKQSMIEKSNETEESKKETTPEVTTSSTTA